VDGGVGYYGLRIVSFALIMFIPFVATTNAVIRSPSKNGLLDVSRSITQVLLESISGRDVLISMGSNTIDISHPESAKHLTNLLESALRNDKKFVGTVKDDDSVVGEIGLDFQPVLRWQFTIPIRANSFSIGEEKHFASRAFNLIDRGLLQDVFFNWSDFSSRVEPASKRSGVWLHGNKWWLFVFHKLSLISSQRAKSDCPLVFGGEWVMRLVSTLKSIFPNDGLCEFEYNHKQLKKFVLGCNPEFEAASNNHSVASIFDEIKASPNEWLKIN
jgi:hypothetical protein